MKNNSCFRRVLSVVLVLVMVIALHAAASQGKVMALIGTKQRFPTAPAVAILHKLIFKLNKGKTIGTLLRQRPGFAVYSVLCYRV